MYWAHSDPDGLAASHENSRWQPLAVHLRNVAELAERFAVSARPDDDAFRRTAWAVGMLHDAGKYSPEFQRLIRGEIQKAPHAAHGAALAWSRCSSGEGAFSIVGHHTGIPNPQGGTASLAARVKGALEAANSLWPEAIKDCPELAEAIENLPASQKPLDLRTRMLFSCLIDADRLDSASRTPSAESLRPRERLQALMNYIERRACAVPEGLVKTIRAQVLSDCLAAGNFAENLLSLIVPTGGGKTLASLALALQRAVQQPEKVRRIIVVIPYLSIIEQNAGVFADAFGQDAILEHHSGNFERLKIQNDRFVPDDADAEDAYDRPWRHPATENWDAPIIVTTSVRFFESIFSNRPSDLRRLHNVARSIVILDEVQTLPRKFLDPLLKVMEGLATGWDTTFVFCTATQPAFQKPPNAAKSDPRWQAGSIREVIGNSPDHFEKLRRVSVDWSLEQPLPWSELAARLIDSPQALAVVNVRDHAAELFKVLTKQAGHGEGLFHLSTRMCAAHRLSKLAAIRERLRKGERCVVASTQLIEAGVDLDFPVVYRALAPFDSIVQAAGRCDREGRLTAQLGKPGGKLIVFLPEDGKTPPHEYREATDITLAMARNSFLSIDDPEVMSRYFHRYYGDASPSSLGKDLQEARENTRFQDVADEFRMIAEFSRDVFVPWDEEAKNLLTKLDQIGRLTGELRHKLQRYVVGLSPNEFLRAKRGAIRRIRDSDLWVCVEGMYDPDLGILIDPTADSMVI